MFLNTLNNLRKLLNFDEKPAPPPRPEAPAVRSPVTAAASIVAASQSTSKENFTNVLFSSRLSMHLLSAEEIDRHLMAMTSTPVHEKDGNFFESFAALAWKQENRKLRFQNEEDKMKDLPPPKEEDFGIEPRKPACIPRKEYELLYIEVLYTIKHKIGKTADTHSDYFADLYSYAQHAFGLSNDDHRRLMEKADESKPPKIVLNVEVVEARALEAKDANGYSDPYCMLGISPGGSGGRQKGSTGDSPDEAEEKRPEQSEPHGFLKRIGSSIRKSKKEKGQRFSVRDRLPAKFIRTTDVKRETLHPVWNEKFRFDIDNLETDALHLDIWDHDDEVSVFDAARKLNEVASIKGLSRYFKQVAQSARTNKKDDSHVDDFLGSVNVPLNNLPSTGLDCWFNLEGRTHRSHVEGQIRLRLSPATREDRGVPEEDNWTDVKQQGQLLEIFIDHELNTIDSSPYQWHGNLSVPAKTILHQHAIQGDITPVQAAMCRWLAYSNKLRQHHLDYEILYKVLKELDKLWVPSALSRDEIDALRESFEQFLEHCNKLLFQLRCIFPGAITAACGKLESMLKCLSTIYDMELFKKCSPFAVELEKTVVESIKEGTLQWYEKLKEEAKPMEGQEEDTLRTRIEVIGFLIDDAHVAVKYYNMPFELIVGVHFFDLTYKTLEKKLMQDVLQTLQDELGPTTAEDHPSEFNPLENTPTAEQIGTTLFELYLNLQEYLKFSQHLSQTDRKQLQIAKYHELFQSSLKRWLTIARFKALKRIKNYVELDKVEVTEKEAKYSSSSVEVSCCFSQVKEFWKKLAWPDTAGSYTFVLMLINDLCQEALYYADLIWKRITAEAAAGGASEQLDDTRQVDAAQLVSDREIALAVNNVEQIRRCFKSLPQDLSFEQIEAAISRQAEPKVGKSCRETLERAVRSLNEEIDKKIRVALQRIGEKLRVDLKKHIFHLSESPEAVPAGEAIGPLLEFLDKNLIVLNELLMKANFDRVLEMLWELVLEEIQKTVETDSSREPSFYKRLSDALLILVEFFNANDKGLPLDRIQTDYYRAVEGPIRLRSVDTEKLISLYFEEKIKEQNFANEYGILHVRCFYRSDSKSLVVEVLNARDLPALDSNGFSDPYVEVELLPRHIFTKCKKFTTEVVKKTLNPCFDEVFEFQVDESQLSAACAVLHLVVMDHDVMWSNDFAGEAFIQTKQLPGIERDLGPGGYSDLKERRLNLTHPKETGEDSETFKSLTCRTWDKIAQDFVKTRRELLDKVL